MSATRLEYGRVDYRRRDDRFAVVWYERHGERVMDTLATYDEAADYLREMVNRRR